MGQRSQRDTYQPKNAIIQARISCRRSNVVKIISEPNIEIAITPLHCSIAIKFGREFHPVTGDTLQMFKVKDQRSRSQRQRQKRWARAASSCNALAVATFSRV